MQAGRRRYLWQGLQHDTARAVHTRVRVDVAVRQLVVPLEVRLVPSKHEEVVREVVPVRVCVCVCGAAPHTQRHTARAVRSARATAS